MDLSTDLIVEGLRRTRNDLNLSREKLAELAGISHRSIQHIENGITKNPGIQTVFDLISAMEKYSGKKLFHVILGIPEPTLLEEGTIAAINQATKEAVAKSLLAAAGKQPGQSRIIQVFNRLKQKDADKVSSLIEKVEAGTISTDSLPQNKMQSELFAKLLAVKHPKFLQAFHAYAVNLVEESLLALMHLASPESAEFPIEKFRQRSASAAPQKRRPNLARKKQRQAGT